MPLACSATLAGSSYLLLYLPVLGDHPVGRGTGAVRQQEEGTQNRQDPSGEMCFSGTVDATERRLGIIVPEVRHLYVSSAAATRENSRHRGAHEGAVRNSPRCLGDRGKARVAMVPWYLSRQVCMAAISERSTPINGLLQYEWAVPS